MHILKARAAPHFVGLPAKIIDLYQAKELGKGEIITLAHLALYGYGKHTLLEGSTEEFADKLGIELRTLQRHLPRLAKSGCISYRRPHRGYWVISIDRGFDSSTSEMTTSIVSSPVVGVVDDFKSFPEQKVNKYQQHQQQAASKSEPEPIQPPVHICDVEPKHDPDNPYQPSRAIRAFAKEVQKFGMNGLTAVNLVYHHGIARTQEVMDHMAKNKHKIANPAGFIYSALENGYDFGPKDETEPDRDDDWWLEGGEGIVRS